MELKTRLAVKFCDNCGASLSSACPNCGAANRPGARFCADCGQPLTAASPGASAGSANNGEPVAERRLVSVVFADLVGFTPFAEERDAEDVRDTLTRYFDLRAKPSTATAARSRSSSATR